MFNPIGPLIDGPLVVQHLFHVIRIFGTNLNSMRRTPTGLRDRLETGPSSLSKSNGGIHKSFLTFSINKGK